MKGKIIKGIAGFYYVHAGDALHSTDGIYECKAKGVFRKDHRKPLVGDDVEMDIIDEAQKKGNITGLLPRHSELIRPAVANVDQRGKKRIIVPSMNRRDFRPLLSVQGKRKASTD